MKTSIEDFIKGNPWVSVILVAMIDNATLPVWLKAAVKAAFGFSSGSYIV